MIDSATGCPDDYAGLYTHYFGVMRSLVAKAGIAPQDVEDVTSEILAKMVEKDIIGWYDPDKLFDTGPNPRIKGERFRTAKFGSLLRRFVLLYVRSHLDKQERASRREVLIAFGDADSHTDYFESESFSSGEDQVIWNQFSADLFDYLVQMDEVRAGILETYTGAGEVFNDTDQVTGSVLAQRLECSPAVARRRLSDLRTAIAAYDARD